MISLIAFYILLFLFGAVLASFAGVIMERGRGGFEFERLPEILGGRSYCPGCKKSKKIKNHTLTIGQLVPIFGQLFQGGKCFRCKSSIPWWYMWFEIGMGLLFVIVGRCLVGGHPEALLLDGGIVAPQLLFWLFVVRAGAAILVADILWYELNVWLWLFLMIWIPVWAGYGLLSLKMAIFWMLILVAIYLAIYQFGRRYVKKVFGQDGEGFGQGDVMLAAVIGLLFPFLASDMGWVEQVQLVLMYLVMSSFVGMLFRYARLILTKDDNKMMPFLPAMMVGYLLVMIRGPILVDILAY